jgi:4-diphosphocytidyl-2-C-methyl-D-erythritol kinase
MGGIMTKIKLKAPGKINWTLDVLGKRPDGYHQVEMLMQSIDLWDVVTLTDSPLRGHKSYRGPEIHIRGNSEKMPLDERNLAVKAARLIMNRFEISSRLEIEIIKNIPMEAGLAGGSTDAAAVLVGLNSLWHLGLSVSDLAALGTTLGADVPFCITGGTAVARNIGEELQPLAPLKGIWLVLVKPSYGMSTAAAYQGLDLKSKKTHPDWKLAYQSLQAGRLSDLHNNLGNVLESVTEAYYPEIGTIKNSMIKAGALASSMTGSGPTVFGVFSNPDDAHEADRRFKLNYEHVYTVSTLDKGVEIIEGGLGPID